MKICQNIGKGQQTPRPVLHMSKEDKRRRENDKMKEFFEDLGKRLGETAETVTSRAGDAIEIQRLKSQIRGLARENAVDLMELGRAVYNKYKAGEKVEEQAHGLCDAIRDREESIRGYEKKIAGIKGASECSGCGKMVAKDMSYCPYCGEKVADADTAGEQDQEEAEEETAGEYADSVKDKMADAAEDMAEKASEAAKKMGKAAQKAARKTGEMAGKAAEKTGEAMEKAAEKTGEAMEKAAEKIGDMADKASEKLNKNG